MGGAEYIFDHDEGEGVAVDRRVEFSPHHTDTVGDQVDDQQEKEAGNALTIFLLGFKHDIKIFQTICSE